MKFKFVSGTLEKQSNDCLVVGIYEDHELTAAAKKLNIQSKGYLANILKKDTTQGKIGQTLMLYHVPHITNEQILLVGCGKKNTPLSARDFRKILFGSIKTLNAAKIKKPLLALTELEVKEHDLAWKITQTVEMTFDALYQFNAFKSSKEPKNTLEQISLYLATSATKAAENALKLGLAISQGVRFTKDLANTPSNVCTPTYLAKEAALLAKKYKTIKTKVLEERDMAKLGMGAFLAVTQGSAQAAKLICLEYKGTAKKMAPIVLIGKGITFDTGGLSLKPADSMVGMKYDMCGAATILGTLKAIAELGLSINVVGLLATAENMPSGTAIKPEDIVTSLSGQTIEIMNTDAEGRLVLCDALTYAERYKPDTVIDIATLTGAIVVALGHHATGLIANYQPLADELLAAGIESHDRAWQMPLWDEYQDQLKSPFADMSNVGGRTGGAITAGCFLSRFAKKFHWAHLDVAGTAAMMMGGVDRFATGRPVPMLTQFLLTRAKK
jgi:leucyl aminopeptidase